jgi:glyoxylase-like metal-dependent hydrolase (beta-lactamase superfamily II)
VHAYAVRERDGFNLIDTADQPLGWEHDARVLAVAGHTRGSIAAWFERDRTLVAGDAIASHEGQPILVGWSTAPGAASRPSVWATTVRLLPPAPPRRPAYEVALVTPIKWPSGSLK